MVILVFISVEYYTVQLFVFRLGLGIDFNQMRPNNTMFGNGIRRYG